jgi:hypothetical protein
MTVFDSLPSADDVAVQIVKARKERALLRRLYRLVLEAKLLTPNPIQPQQNRSKAERAIGGDNVQR